MSDPGLIDRYGWRLGFASLSAAVGMGEGRAPLISAEALLASFGYRGEFYIHLEHVSPHGSYRDRGAAVAISAALRQGLAAVYLNCAEPRSNDVLAAYALRAGLKQIARDEVADPEQSIDESSIDWRLGLSTAAWDVFDSLGGRAPEHHLCPSKELADALCAGYATLRAESATSSMPAVEHAQAEATERAHAGLERLGITPNAARSSALEAVLERFAEQRFQAPSTVVLSLPE